MTLWERKWWLRLIRERNYFGFRYWWFNWTVWLICLTLFCLLFCKRSFLNESESCSAADITNSIAKVRDALDACCSCNTVSVDTPVVDTTVLECPERALVFQICNSNKARDDDFEVYLNDVKIGELHLNVNDDVGSVFIASSNSELRISRADFSCPLSKMETYHFSPTVVKKGKNRIRLENIRNNENGNAGDIQLRNYLIEGNALSSPCKVMDLRYGMGSGSDFVVDFMYEKCCE